MALLIELAGHFFYRLTASLALRFTNEMHDKGEARIMLANSISLLYCCKMPSQVVVISL